MKWTPDGGKRSTWPCWIAIGCSIVLAAASCVERKERITIAADRSVTIELAYEGGPGELDQEDAMPSAEAGWDVTRSVKKDGEDEKHVLRAKRTFAPGEPLPGDAGRSRQYPAIEVRHAFSFFRRTAPLLGIAPAPKHPARCQQSAALSISWQQRTTGY